MNFHDTAMNEQTRFATSGYGSSETPCRRGLEWLPPALFPALTIPFRHSLIPWQFMWLLAFAIYLGCKWLTWQSCQRASVSPWRTIAYFTAWPGMDATAFLSNRSPVAKPRLTAWLGAFGKTLFGITLLCGILRTLPASSPLLVGWCGLIGLIFVLHFGTFHLLALAFQSFGFDARPLMRAPILAISLGEFWGKRWNSAFHEIAFRFAFCPLRRLLTPIAASVLVFILSGLVHDIVISFPARGGYGLPTAYFLVQGLGMLAERSKPGQRLGLGRGARGRAFTILVTAGPVFWLFHPTFIHHIILPMLHDLRAI
jgi:hypothetical protein